MIVERGRRRVGGERDVGEEKRKMPPFQLPYSSNEMLTVEGSNRSKCMKPELVNCSLCGSCAIQHPSPVWTQSKAFLFGIISSPPNLTEAAQTASAPHFNMKVQNVFHIICSFSNACIFYFPPHREEVRNAIRRTDTGKECGKKKVQGCLVHIFSQCPPVHFSLGTSQPRNFLLPLHCGRGCNAHILLCAHPSAGCLADWLLTF